jgi:hypothetical protein
MTHEIRGLAFGPNGQRYVICSCGQLVSRIVRVQHVTVTECAACGGTHEKLALFDVICGPGIRIDSREAKAIACPSRDYKIVLIDTVHIDEESLPEDGA